MPQCFTQNFSREPREIFFGLKKQLASRGDFSPARKNASRAAATFPRLEKTPREPRQPFCEVKKHPASRGKISRKKMRENFVNMKNCFKFAKGSKKVKGS